MKKWKTKCDICGKKITDLQKDGIAIVWVSEKQPRIICSKRCLLQALIAVTVKVPEHHVWTVWMNWAKFTKEEIMKIVGLTVKKDRKNDERKRH